MRSRGNRPPSWRGSASGWRSWRGRCRAPRSSRPAWHRAELERLRSEQGLERERGRLEAAKLREVLDQRERELRTLVLEMGKTEGRLEVAERKLLEAHRAVAAARTVEGLPASSARGGRRVLTQAALALCAVAAVYTLLELALSSRALRQVEAAHRPLLTLASELRALGEDQRRTALDALLAGELPEYPQLAAPLPPFQRDELRRWAEAELGYRSASSDDSVAGN
jgi:hypothetical protein